MPTGGGPCRHCGGFVTSETSERCSHCGIRRPRHQDLASMAYGWIRQLTPGRRFSVLAALVIGGLILLGQLSSGEGREVEAYVVCENAVERRLRAPSTAQFAGYTGAGVRQNGDEYRIRFWVDAENGVGAKLRHDVTCRVRKEDAGWHLAGLRLDPR